MVSEEASRQPSGDWARVKILAEKMEAAFGKMMVDCGQLVSTFDLGHWRFLMRVWDGEGAITERDARDALDGVPSYEAPTRRAAVSSKLYKSGLIEKRVSEEDGTTRLLSPTSKAEGLITDYLRDVAAAAAEFCNVASWPGERLTQDDAKAIRGYLNRLEASFGIAMSEFGTILGTFTLPHWRVLVRVWEADPEITQTKAKAAIAMLPKFRSDKARRDVVKSLHTAGMIMKRPNPENETEILLSVAPNARKQLDAHFRRFADETIALVAPHRG